MSRTAGALSVTNRQALAALRTASPGRWVQLGPYTAGSAHVLATRWRRRLAGAGLGHVSVRVGPPVADGRRFLALVVGGGEDLGVEQADRSLVDGQAYLPFGKGR